MPAELIECAGEDIVKTVIVAGYNYIMMDMVVNVMPIFICRKSA